MLGLALAVGCQNATPPTTAPTKEPADPPAATPPTTATPPVAAGPPKEWHQLDPAKHELPDSALIGKLDGTPFAPTATLTGVELTFRVAGTPTVGERAITLKLPRDRFPLTPARRMVRPTDDPGDERPEIEVVGLDAAGKPTRRLYLNGYALTYEFGPAAGSQLPGRIYLSLPDEAKSYLVGKFAAEVQRGPDERPTAADAPYIQGALTIIGMGEVEVGYVGAPGNQVVTDSVAVTPPAAGAPPGVMATSDTLKPRATALVRSVAGAWRYEHTGLPPGRYLVYARQADGPTAWEWVTLGEKGELDRPLTLDAKAAGRVTVTLPAGATGVVQLLPVDPQPDGAAIPDVALAYALKYEAKVESGKASFANVAPGRYTAKSGDKGVAVTVTAGQGATAEVK